MPKGFSNTQELTREGVGFIWASGHWLKKFLGEFFSVTSSVSDGCLTRFQFWTGSPEPFSTHNSVCAALNLDLTLQTVALAYVMTWKSVMFSVSCCAIVSLCLLMKFPQPCSKQQGIP